MRDDRQNFVSDGGVPTDTVFLDQRETMTELGPFAQLQWSPRERLLVSGGARFDWVNSASTTTSSPDGDDSGDRDMSALSGNIGASWSFEDQFVPYVNVSTSFETPTTTELVNQPDGSVGDSTRTWGRSAQ